MSGEPIAVVVPVKRFTDAKERLAGALGPDERADLARRLAAGVGDAAGDLPVVVSCDDDEVRSWAEARGHRIAWTPGRDLDGAVTQAVETLAADGVGVAAVAHADLPFPQTLRDVARRGGPGRAVIVGDRHGDGTNVLVVPTTVGWRFAYGPGSRDRHVAEAERLGLEVDLVDDERLAWDVDHPDDLHPPAHLGRPAWDRSDVG